MQDFCAQGAAVTIVIVVVVGDPPPPEGVSAEKGSQPRKEVPAKKGGHPGGGPSPEGELVCGGGAVPAQSGVLRDHVMGALGLHAKSAHTC